MPNRGFESFLPVTLIFKIVHAELGERYAAAACNQNLCSATLYFLHTASGALVGGWRGYVFLAGLSVEDAIPDSRDLDAE